ncbi:MAG: DNA polymerase III subunit beta [Thermobacillus sp. ZCTH02-B1]|uniref:DNA polymerase III subunit beta n=1 Tax=Thermobacillus sp. ZCTH02-B1 TaxID=1858795 RepID=UPI000B562950|nr:DNA polymerase III subunit beta [Thermobacillus sp. ZCTH02-B1]OUM93720.1 MAG: DNA polymerase III subunit beta [Thermobacillus sp. ZCTH02-B1]
MKLTIRKNELNEAVQQAAKAVSSKPAIPILSGIKFEADANGLTLTASDTEISIQTFVPANIGDEPVVRVERPGSIVLSARFMAEIVKKLPEDEIEFEQQGSFNVTIRSGATDIQMIGLDAEEFPVLPDLGSLKTVTIPGDRLKNMIRQTIFAASTNEQTPILTGVQWRLAGGELKFTATDRHRLSTCTAAVDAAEDERIDSIVIAARTLNELSRIVPDAPDPVEIAAADNQVLFRIGRVLFYSRVLDGSYPDTSRIIPQEFKTEMEIETRRLTDAIERAYLMSREEKTNIVRIVTLDGGDIEISSSSTELGRVTERMRAMRLEGDELRIAFNSKYMLDALRVIDSERIFIGFNGSMSPIVIRPTDQSDRQLHIILPYRTTG